MDGAGAGASKPLVWRRVSGDGSTENADRTGGAWVAAGPRLGNAAGLIVQGLALGVPWGYLGVWRCHGDAASVCSPE